MVRSRLFFRYPIQEIIRLLYGCRFKILTLGRRRFCRPHFRCGSTAAGTILETERIRREVAASLEDWRIDEARIEAEMSAEEAFDVEAFDVDAYR